MKANKKRVMFFDTTSRDGKQSPGNQHGPDDTVILAKQLAALGADIMEAGFPIACQADFDAVRRVAEEVQDIRCCALARSRDEDIERAAEALKNALLPPRIHVFIASSDIHMENKLRKRPDEVVAIAVAAVRKAREFVDDVEFSPEDASRTGFEFLKRIVHAAIVAGASTINIPDTVGYAIGAEFGTVIRRLIQEVPIITEKGITISVHCHNDLGMATANALAGLENGARQVECTINGIGERAGNTHFAEVVMALKTRYDYYGLDVGIDTTQIGPTARLLCAIIGKPIPDTLPVVGENVFAHGSGIHQHGVGKDRATYEIMDAESVGWKGELFPLSSQSGRSGLGARLQDIGYSVDSDLLGVVYERFVQLAQSKALVYNADLHMLMQEIAGEQHAQKAGWIRLVRVDYHKIDDKRSVIVHLACGDQVFEASDSGSGPVHAAWNAIKVALERQNLWPGKVELAEFDIGKSIGGVDAFGMAQVKIACNGNIAYGRGSNTDIVVAYVQAELAALNHLIFSPIEEM